MPYNTSAIPPRKEPTGQAQLPLSRVKKIITQDPDIQVCSNNAAFIITLATEMFIQHLADEAYTQAKLERKPRRNIQYKDIANAISHHDNLEFLEDVAPKTIPFKKAKASQAHLRGEGSIAPSPSSQSQILSNGHGEANDSAIIHHGHHHHHHHRQNNSTDHASNGSAFFTLASRDHHKQKPKQQQQQQQQQKSKSKSKSKPKHQRQNEPVVVNRDHEDEGEGDSNAQLELEMRQALRPAKDKADIDMTG